MRIIEDQMALIEPESSASFYETMLQVGPRETRSLKQVFPDQNSPGLPEEISLQQSLASAVVRLVAEEGVSRSIFQWITLADTPHAQDLLGIGRTANPPLVPLSESFLSSIGEDGLLGDAYCAVVPPDLRHRLGEHYTPPWLVERIASLAEPRELVCDPACGDGRFLVTLARNGHALDSLFGVELNPLAVMFARWNMWSSIGKPQEVPPCRIEWGDFLLPEWLQGKSHSTQSSTYDFILGNPPWVTWRTISSDYRAMLARAMSRSSLNVRRGWEARVSAGQTDLSHLFIHESLEQLRDGGRVAFVLPRSTFKGPVGAAPIRSGLTNSGRKYAYTEVWDVDAQEAFTEVRSDTTVAFISVDSPQRFPVPWKTISREREGSQRVVYAKPSDPSDLSSSWTTNNGSSSTLTVKPPQERAELRARGGINTGGANSVFHLVQLSSESNRVTVRNVISRKANGEYPTVTSTLESDLVHPLLRGRDIKPWSALPTHAILVPHQARDLRKPIPAGELERSYPLVSQYLATFQRQLESRKELARWGGEWHSLFRIGPYTAGCWRLVWPHSSGQSLRAAVLSADDRTVPDQKVVMVPFDSKEPALFYCALLNSSPVRDLVQSTSGLDASPNIVKRIPLPKFDYSLRSHSEVVAVAERALANPADADAARLADLVKCLYA